MSMSVNHARGTVVFDGEPSLFYIANCAACEMRMPFYTAGERDDWARAHSETGHEVKPALEVRP